MYYVYRFLDKDCNVVYVGRTVHLHNRMRQHFNGGHLSEEKYDSVTRIDYLELKTKNDMKIKELYYIGKYRPIYNTADNHGVSFDMDELKDVWVSYTKKEVATFFSMPHEELEKYKHLANTQKEKLDKLQHEIEERIEREQTYLQQIESFQQKIVVQVPKRSNHRKLLRYQRMVKMLKREPQLRGLRIIEDTLSTVLKKHGDEIHAICSKTIHTPAQTIIMESNDRKREHRIFPEVERMDLQAAIEICACEHWDVSWEQKPYRKPVKLDCLTT